MKILNLQIFYYTNWYLCYISREANKTRLYLQRNKNCFSIYNILESTPKAIFALFITDEITTSTY